MGHEIPHGPDDGLADDTIESSTNWQQAGARRVACLSVAWHADLARVGDVYLLDPPPPDAPPRPVALSRLDPVFFQPAGAPTGPLRDRRLSRQPLQLTVEADGAVTLDATATPMPVLLDGRPLTAVTRVERQTVTRGVTIELAGAVLLVLHEYEPALTRSMVHWGPSDALSRIVQEVYRVAGGDFPLLVRGESGSGKELIARAIHAIGRPAGRMVTAHVSEIGSPQALVGAVAKDGSEAREGLCQDAEGGTLLLDGIEHASVDLQLMLLNVIERRRLRRIGSDRLEPINVRFIATCQRNLRDAVREGTFRGPLLHLLAGYEIVVPPLRERPEDVGPLFLRFLREALEEAGRPQRLAPAGPKDPVWLSAEQVGWLVRHSWPGNVRQVRNVARALAIRCQDDEVVPSERVTALLDGEALPDGEPIPLPAPPPPPPQEQWRGQPSKIPSGELIAALRLNHWVITRTARYLGISRVSLYNLMERGKDIRQAKDVPVAELRRVFHECDRDLDRTAERLEVSPRALRRRLVELGLL